MPLKSPDLTKFTTLSKVVTNVDFFDNVTGVGFVKIYFAGGWDDSAQYFLTTNSSVVGDELNHRLKSTGAGINADFDIEMTRNFTVAGNNAILTYQTHVDTGENMTVSFIVNHVDKDNTETIIGSVSGANISGSAGAEYNVNTMKVPLTKKRFSKGEKLRIHVVPNGSNVNSSFFCDPSGFWGFTGEDAVVFPFTSYIFLPVEVPQ